MSRPNLYVGLVHFPIKNKRGEVVTTSVTNLDIHDISRAANTFGYQRYFLITPIKKQQQLVGRILGHWEGDEGNLYNPDRSDALKIAHITSSLSESLEIIKEIEGQDPLIVVTTALKISADGGPNELAQKLMIDKRPMLLLFGTGWGLTEEVMDMAHFRLEPIWGANSEGYNHLSVRSAAAIYFDRIEQAFIQGPL
jgi:hypothetical protein